MTPHEYAEFEAAVAAFFEREGLANLSTGQPWCPDCQEHYAMGRDACPQCGHEVEYDSEPGFMWHPCHCCGSHLGGDRYFASGWNAGVKQIQTY
jgi:predicted amidophosphoribosyltransferase